MATIYELSTGRIISENKGVTTVETRAEFQAYSPSLQTVQQDCNHARHPAVDEYMNLIQELLKKL